VSSPTDSVRNDAALEQAWHDNRRHLLDIALRMLGNLSEAEDVVQEGFTRLMRVDLDEIDDVRGWMVVVVSRLCLDRLRATRRHPTSPADALDDEPSRGVGATAVAVDPVDRITLDDSVRIAMHVVLERLSAAERTAFVLHDVFQYPFDSIAEIVGRTPSACRQLASRARRTVRDEALPARFVVEPVEQRAITERFIAACTNGDMDALLAVLDPEVSGEGDGAARPIIGLRAVSHGVMHYLGPKSRTTLLTLPGIGDGTVVALRDGVVVAVVTFTIADGLITHFDAIATDANLAPIRAVLGTR
jgi:RNA polymerase sigma-70 factor (ECF subfamily)